MRRLLSASLLLWSLASLVLVPAIGQARCGRERWSVKTGTDHQATSIKLANQSPTTLKAMSLWHAPNPIPPRARVAPAETKVWVVNATLLKYKIEDDPSSGDSDYHLVLSDSHGRRMIAEIPSPDCVGSSSPFADSIKSARSAFDAKFSPTGSFQTANAVVQIRGVGLFDFAHGQAGHAVNYVEIHPVLGITFGQ